MGNKTKNKTKNKSNNQSSSNNKNKNSKTNKTSSNIPIIYIILAFVFGSIGFLIFRANNTASKPVSITTNNVDITKNDTIEEEKSPPISQNHEYKLLPEYSPLCETELWLNRNESLPGYHVLCVTKNNELKTVTIKYYRDGLESDGKEITLSYNQVFNDILKFRNILERILSIRQTDSLRDSLPKHEKFNPWLLYTKHGKDINRHNIQTHFIGTVLLFEGGNFIYPPVEVGFERHIQIYGDWYDETVKPLSDNGLRAIKNLTLETLSCHPVVLLIRDFVPVEYCDYIISTSDKHMKKSTVSHMHNTNGNANQWRTSTTHWLSNKDKMVHKINLMTSYLTHVSINHQESVQVLRYYDTQQYDSHWDYFDPQLYRGTDMERKISGGKNRLATVFWYMSDVFDSGWTIFPMSGKLPRPKSFKLKKVEDCSKSDGLLVEPRKGNTIIFYSMNTLGEVDPYSLHGACPVSDGQTKWGANKWIWSKPL